MQVASFERIRELVRERSAIVLEPGKEYLVEARLQPILKAFGLANVDELCARLNASSALASEVVEAMTTNETSFFRDLHPFEALRTEVLPELIARRRKEKTLDIWCAACSTGQEPYSVGILLREHFPELADWTVTILATDISQGVLTRARGGRYRQVEVNRGLSANQLLKHFDRSGLEWQIKHEIRSMVSFSPLNLIAEWPAMPTFDVVFMRNVLIYFDVETKQRILNRVERHLEQDGYLFLGGAETTVNIAPNFERAPFERASCYRFARPTVEKKRAW
jgi:chemotaxis protein methyltransferase CheR